jgi:hypothetical protein
MMGGGRSSQTTVTNLQAKKVTVLTLQSRALQSTHPRCDPTHTPPLNSPGPLQKLQEKS